MLGLIYTLAVLITLAATSYASGIGLTITGAGSTYPFGFFSLSSTTASDANVGKVQILVCSAPATANMELSYHNASFDMHVITTATGSLNDSFNPAVYDPNVMQPITTTQLPNGLAISADSDIRVYANKADKGRAGGYLVFPITQNSNQFFIAGWTAASTTNYAGILVSTVVAGTTVNIYSISSGTSYTQLASVVIADGWSTALYNVSFGTDTTGLYVNSTQPIGVVSGVTCAYVPVGISYCGHLAEMMPPVSELGTYHVVPGIYGRSNSSAGYTIRVVATDVSTTVSWYSAVGTTNLSGTVLTRGAFVEISCSKSVYPTMVNCSKPCVVMQYNRGVFQVTPLETVNTAPFMMLTTPTNHFVSSTCFETASLYNSLQVDLNDMLNYMTVVAKTADIGNVYYDGAQLTSLPAFSSSYVIGEFTAVGGAIAHGSHSVTARAGTTSKFAAYVYGHGTSTTTRSSYGFTTTYEVFGARVGTYVAPKPTKNMVIVVKSCARRQFSFRHRGQCNVPNHVGQRRRFAQRNGLFRSRFMGRGRHFKGLLKWRSKVRQKPKHHPKPRR
jgi:hypothetical protein